MDLIQANGSTFRVTEELARWRFELEIKASENWWIAFTNPTAGPWKRLMGRKNDGTMGEVHRFQRDEDRPDLVLVCDAAREIAIIEAKDTLEKLIVKSQVIKSVGVITNLARLLSEKSDNSYWRERAHYGIVAGLLWASVDDTSAKSFDAMVKHYRDELPRVAIFGVEVLKDPTGQLSCRELWAPRTRPEGMPAMCRPACLS